MSASPTPPAAMLSPVGDAPAAAASTTVPASASSTSTAAAAAIHAIQTAASPFRVKKAIIPISGLGTRMYPASAAVCKALMPLVDTDGLLKPILHIILEEALSALQWVAPTEANPNPASNKDIRVAIVVSGQEQQQQIQRYFSEASALPSPDASQRLLHRRLASMGERLDFIVQEKPRGFGHAILLCQDWAESEPFLVLLGDHVYLSSQPTFRLGCARQLVDCYEYFAGKEGANVMCSSLAEVGVEEMNSVALVNGTLLQNIDLYASHTALQEQIRAQHLAHGLDLERLRREAEGVSRFARGTPVAPPPAEIIQGDLYRLSKLVEKPEENRAPEFLLPRPAPPVSKHAGFVPSSLPQFSDYAASAHGSGTPNKTHCLLACAGIDLLTADIFPHLERLMDEIELLEEAAAASISDSAPAAPAQPRRELQLRDAQAMVITNNSAPFIGLKVLGSRFDTGQPAAYARAMQSFAAERAERHAQKHEASLLSEGAAPKLQIIGPTINGVATPSGVAPPITPNSAAGAASPAAQPPKLSNAALPKRASYD